MTNDLNLDAYLTRSAAALESSSSSSTIADDELIVKSHVRGQTLSTRPFATLGKDTWLRWQSPDLTSMLPLVNLQTLCSVHGIHCHSQRQR